jgi:hypothetical protein
MNRFKWPCFQPFPKSRPTKAKALEVALSAKVGGVAECTKERQTHSQFCIKVDC